MSSRPRTVHPPRPSPICGGWGRPPPPRRTAAWWAKDWMERHTYFLPRYEDGRMVNEGHALASAAGIACLMRRTYKHETEPAPPGRYDFVTYFECADADVPTFHEVCASLRD